jgi:N-acetylmuramoyl-L-alanine amidase
MSRHNRAAGFAAATLVAASGILYAGPSRAWEFNTPPVVSPELGAVSSQTFIPSPESTEAPVVAADAAPEPAVTVETAPAKPAEPTPTRRRRSLTELVNAHAASSTRGAEHECLANAVYFETRGEPLSGQLSVAEVVVNRARSGRFPKNLCGVVKQKGQFSFVRGGRLPSVPRSSAAWRKAVAIAHIALEDLADGAAPRALFFHAKKVRPAWRGLQRVASVGNHVFYR